MLLALHSRRTFFSRGKQHAAPAAASENAARSSTWALARQRITAFGLNSIYADSSIRVKMCQLARTAEF